MSALVTLLAVSLGAGLGAQARYGLELAFTRKSTTYAARAILVANVAGSALIGVMVGVLNNEPGNPEWWAQVIAAGFAGGLTTFSTMANQVIDAARVSKARATWLVAAHSVFGFTAAIGAWWVTLKFLG